MITSTIRLKILAVIFLLFGFLILGRLFTWQIIQGETLAISARSQQQITSDIPASRGAILASDNFPLASSSTSWLIWASRPKIKEPEKIAKKLAPFLVTETQVDEDMVKMASYSGEARPATAEPKSKAEAIIVEEERLFKLLTKTDVVWVALKQKVDRKIKEEIDTLNIEGLGFDPQESRSYPEQKMASHLLGFVGVDAGGFDKGYFGLEGFYNLTLQGSRGEKAWEKDASGRPILIGDGTSVSPLNGVTIKTHIDRTVQYIIEKHLKDGVEKYKALGGSVIVMRPKDGAILGISSFPGFDPKHFNIFENSRFADPAVTMSFEPGSIFKVLVMAAALDTKAVESDTKCDDCDGPRQIAEYSIDSGTKQYYPETTMSDVIFHSDNVGMVWVSERLGHEKLYNYLTAFGVGQSTGIDLQGEIAPNLRKKDEWRLIDLATASFGQGVVVTGIQMVRAVGVIANNGIIVTPQVVDSLIGDSWEDKIEAKIGDRVISEKATSQITEMMVRNVDLREDWDKPEHIKIAGKTGTAQVPIAGHYDPDKTVASFIGFAPAQNPEYVMLVSLKDPQAAPFASQTAAPLWFAISKELLPYLGAQPN